MKTEAKQVIIACLVAGVVLTATGYSLWRQFRPNLAARQEMRHFIARVQLGDSLQQVQQKFRSGNYKILKPHKRPQLGIKPTPNLWSVSTPAEMGRGWVLYMEFHKNKVVAARLRIYDSASMRPKESAPED